MYTEYSTSPVRTALFRAEPANLNQKKETFHEIFHRTLNNKSNSRPPKMELTGVLVPCDKIVRDRQCKFRLDTDANEYFLCMSPAVALVAKRVEWEEVTVKGYLDPELGIFEVEKISLSHGPEPLMLMTGPDKPFIEIDKYKQTIARRGKLEIAADYCIS